jgi:hypothetical protein
VFPGLGFRVYVHEHPAHTNCCFNHLPQSFLFTSAWPQLETQFHLKYCTVLLCSAGSTLATGMPLLKTHRLTNMLQTPWKTHHKQIHNSEYVANSFEMMKVKDFYLVGLIIVYHPVTDSTTSSLSIDGSRLSSKISWDECPVSSATTCSSSTALSSL